MEICEQERCTGCGACVAACPVSCIRLVEGDLLELRPRVDEISCISCGTCRRACPNNAVMTYRYPKACYAAYVTDAEDRRESASGGIGTAVARHAIGHRGAIVYGTAWDERLRATVIAVEDVASLGALKGSKYVHSLFPMEAYHGVREWLSKGREVLFVGTPCQVAGLLGYMGGEREGLLTVDLICHGVCPSAYLDEELRAVNREHNIGSISNIRFRGNERYTNFIFSLWDGQELIFRQRENPYLTCFLEGIGLRENCYSCAYARPERVSDITIGDFIGLGDKVPFAHDARNASCVFVNTERGSAFFDELVQADKRLVCEERDYSERLGYGPSLRHPFARSPLSGEFVAIVREGGYSLARERLLVPRCRANRARRYLSYSWRAPRKLWRMLKARIFGGNRGAC